MTIPILGGGGMSNYRIGQKQPDKRPRAPMPTPTIKEMVAARLLADGFDGLFREGECACKLEELMPCGEPSEYCQAGYLQPAPEDSDYDYFIGESREGEK